MQLSQKPEIFSKLFFAFSKFRLNFEDFQKVMTRIADVFLNLPLPKKVVR